MTMKKKKKKNKRQTRPPVRSALHPQNRKQREKQKTINVIAQVLSSPQLGGEHQIGPDKKNNDLERMVFQARKAGRESPWRRLGPVCHEMPLPRRRPARGACDEP